MEDYEKFDQLIENLDSTESSIDPEIAHLAQIVQSLKDNQPHPSAAARMRSQQMMLAESKSIRDSKKAQRLSFIGSLYGWAVPAVLILAVVGVVLGNSSGDETNAPGTLQSGSAPAILATTPAETEADSGDKQNLQSSDGAEVLIEPTSTLTITLSITRNVPGGDGPAAEPIPADLVPYPSPEAESREAESITMPDGEGGEVVVPERPLPGSSIQPPDGSDGGTIVPPRPGDGREGGRNPDS